jgi:hypothetical protein
MKPQAARGVIAEFVAVALVLASCGAGRGWESTDDGLHTSERVGIGTAKPQAELAVKGLVVAEEVKVTVEGWADYVFAPGYELRSLDELERYTQANRRLPGIPSAREVASGGVDLGASQRALLERLEETTLYLFELKRESAALRARIDALEAAEQR